MKKYYSGIGSRDTPPDILETMSTLANALGHLGYILRSGGASGADVAFEAGCDQGYWEKEIFLPWRKFEDHDSHFHNPTAAAVLLAEKVHPAYPYLKHGAQLLIARNMHQVLGYQLDDPVKFIVCYTPDGAQTAKDVNKKTGGTGSAITLASMNNIEVFNLQREGRLEDLYDCLANQ